MKPVNYFKQKNFDNLFTSWFSRNIDYRVLENLRVRFKSEHELEPYSRRHAVMNILGFISQKCPVPSSETPTSFFKRVLKEDPNNINAMQSLIYVYEDMGQTSKASIYKRQFDRVCLCELEEQKLFYARHLYGIAMLMMSREEPFLNKHYKAIVQKLEQAIALGAAVSSDQNEIDLWRFSLGVLYTKIDSILNLRHSEESEWLRLSLQTFLQVVNGKAESLANVEGYKKIIMDGHLDCKGKAWSFIGAMLMRRYSTRNENLRLQDILNDVEAEYKHYDAVKCFDTAELIAPNTSTVLRKIGHAYTTTDEFLDKAKRYLLRDIEAQPTGYSYSLLGQWFLQKYKVAVKKGENKQDYLQKAIINFEAAREKHCDMFALFKYLAQAYEYNREIERALNVFVLCEDTYEGARTAELYELWADLLEKDGNGPAARQKRQLAVDTRAGMNPKQMRDFGVIYAKNDDETVTRFVESVESKFKVQGYFLERDLIPGGDLVEGLGNMERKCRFMIVFITENFNNCNSCKQDLNRIYYERKKRENCPIIPLVVGGAEVPEVLSHLKPILYDKTMSFLSKFESVFHERRTTRRYPFAQHIFRDGKRRYFVIPFIILVMAFLMGFSGVLLG